MARARDNVDPRHMPNVHHLGHHNVLDMLDIKHDAVFNVLVDHCRIEVNVLIRGEDTMVELARQVDPNVRIWWDEKGNRAYTRDRGHTFRATNRDPRTRGGRMTSDREAYVRALGDECIALNVERSQAENDLNHHSRMMDQSSKRNRDAARPVSESRREHEPLVRSRADLDDQVNAAEMEFDSTPFDEDSAAYEHAIGDITVQLKPATESVASMTASVQKLKDEERDAMSRSDSMGADVKRRSDNLGQCTENARKGTRRWRFVLPYQEGHWDQGLHSQFIRRYWRKLERASRG